MPCLYEGHIGLLNDNHWCVCFYEHNPSVFNELVL